MGATVDVSIPVDVEAAPALADLRMRDAVGRIVSQMLRPQPGGRPMDLLGLEDSQPRRRLTAEELHADYAAMAADEAGEADALEWIEGLLGDVATEPSRHEQ